MVDQKIAYPWMADVGAQLKQHPWPAGFLLSGASGIGKYATVQALLEAHHGQALAHCPDVIEIIPAAHYISIDQIRAAVDFVHLSARGQKGKSIIINHGDRMTLAASNALLKIVEEPPEQTTFWLITDTPFAVPATVRSRCRWVKLGLPSLPVAQQWLTAQKVEQADFWLHLAHGAPLKALDLAADAQNKTFISQSAKQFMQWLQAPQDQAQLSKHLWTKPQLGILLLLAFAEDALRHLMDACEQVRFKKIATRLTQRSANFEQHWAQMIFWRRFQYTLSQRPEQCSLLQLEDGLSRWAFLT